MLAQRRAGGFLWTHRCKLGWRGEYGVRRVDWPSGIEDQSVTGRMSDLDATATDLLRAAVNGEAQAHNQIRIFLGSPAARTSSIPPFSRSRCILPALVVSLRCAKAEDDEAHLGFGPNVTDRLPTAISPIIGDTCRFQPMRPISTRFFATQV